MQEKKNYSMQDLQNMIAALAVSTQEIKAMFAETDKKFQETDRQFKETDRQFKETDRQFKETDRQFKNIHKSIGALSNRIGDLIENFMGANLDKKFSKLLKKEFNKLSQAQIWKDGDKFLAEVDFVLESANEIILTEVKVKLSHQDITEHLERITKIKEFDKKNGKQNTYLGALATGVLDAQVREQALKEGLFVLSANGDNVEISQPEKLAVF